MSHAIAEKVVAVLVESGAIIPGGSTSDMIRMMEAGLSTWAYWIENGRDEDTALRLNQRGRGDASVMKIIVQFGSGAGYTPSRAAELMPLFAKVTAVAQQIEELTK